MTVRVAASKLARSNSHKRTVDTIENRNAASVTRCGVFRYQLNRRSDVFVVGLAQRGRAIIYIRNDDTLVIDWPLAE